MKLINIARQNICYENSDKLERTLWHFVWGKRGYIMKNISSPIRLYRRFWIWQSSKASIKATKKLGMESFSPYIVHYFSSELAERLWQRDSYSFQRTDHFTSIFNKGSYIYRIYLRLEVNLRPNIRSKQNASMRVETFIVIIEIKVLLGVMKCF